jgi:HlyD family secretion protein
MKRLRIIDPRPRAMIAWLSLPVLLAAAGCGAGRDANLIVAAGHVEATEVRVATKVGGTVAALEAQEGDRVAAGARIARIDTVDLALARRAARAERDLADANLRLRLAGSRREDVAEAAAAVAKAESDFATAEKDLTRFQGLQDAGSGTERSLDDARNRRESATAALEVARQRLRRLRAGFRVEEIDAARAQAAAAAARVAQLDQQIADAVIVSPVAGTLTARPVEQGELLGPGAVVAVVTDLDHAWLTAWVPEPDLGRLQLGQAADVVTDGGERRTGRVTFLASQAEFTPRNVQTRDERVKLVYKVKITLDNGDGLFKPGMPAEARLHTVAARGKS